MDAGGADDLEGLRRQLLRFADDLRVMVERESSRRRELEDAYRALSSSYTAMVRTHPIIGETIVKPQQFLGDAVQIIRYHHERWDGRGYPHGLAGEDIFLPARIFMLADTFDAMTTDRPYRKALPIDTVLEEIDRNAGTQFDPEVARAWIDLVQERERAGSSVTMP